MTTARPRSVRHPKTKRKEQNVSSQNVLNPRWACLAPAIREGESPDIKYFGLGGGEEVDRVSLERGVKDSAAGARGRGLALLSWDNPRYWKEVESNGENVAFSV